MKKRDDRLVRDNDAAFDGKEHDFDVKKPESEVILSPSNSAQSRKQDDKIKKEAKRKSPVESVTRYRDLNAEFEDCSDNSSNEVNTAGSIVPTVGQNSLDITNTFSVAGPLNDVVSPTYGKYSFIDASQLPDDPGMPELEDITNSNDEDVVGAEADFNNLESSISISPIPTPRIHKDHPVSQIIGDLSSTTQTRNDIIFGATNKDLCKSFEKLMKDKFQMRSMGKLTFFLGLQDPDGEDVDVHTYMSMIGSLMYLTLSRPDIMFAVCACVRFQVTPKASHLHAVKRIFRYLKGAMDSKSTAGLWV
nr:hypothetical protein [Tanacetum cinerariifolium]